MRARCKRNAIVIEEGDSGTPVAKPRPDRLGGLGLKLIREVCDRVEIEGPGEYGTRLEMTFFERGQDRPG